MTAEENPEMNGLAIDYKYDADFTCGSSNGDLVKRYDAATNTTCYAYDALHRVQTITYPTGPYSASTPQRNFVYDSATLDQQTMLNAKGRLAMAYTGTPAANITGVGFSYSARGEVTDSYQWTSNSDGYYHVVGSYWPNGLLNTHPTVDTSFPGVSRPSPSRGPKKPFTVPKISHTTQDPAAIDRK